MSLRRWQRRVDRAHLERIERHHRAMVALARAARAAGSPRVAA